MTPRRAFFLVALVPLTASLGLAALGNTAAGALFGAMACLLALAGMAAPDEDAEPAIASPDVRVGSQVGVPPMAWEPSRAPVDVTRQ